jgi:prepilin-type N-terminal cleavage/methylation domain-containing protein
MKTRRNKTGLTLVEILVVVVIIAILVTMVIGIASSIDTQGKERLAESTIALLTAALGEFGDYGYTYSAPPYAGLKFPLDCNNFSDTELGTELGTALGTTVSISSGTNDAEYSGCEVMYFFLNRVPESRRILDKIDRKLVTNLALDGSLLEITVGGQVYPLFRVIDPWGKPLRYSYYDNTNEGSTSEPPLSSPMTFPVITSAGPDRDFNSVGDNISSK